MCLQKTRHIYPGASCCLRLSESAALNLCILLSVTARERTKLVTWSINKVWSPFGNNQRNQWKHRWQERQVCRAAEQNFMAWDVDPQLQEGALKPACLTSCVCSLQKPCLQTWTLVLLREKTAPKSSSFYSCWDACSLCSVVSFSVTACNCIVTSGFQG